MLHSTCENKFCFWKWITCYLGIYDSVEGWSCGIEVILIIQNKYMYITFHFRFAHCCKLLE